MGEWPTWLGGGAVGIFVYGAVQVINTFARRKVTQATAADQLSDSALALVRQAGEDAKAARDEARQARQDADSARRDASEARREATDARREAMTAVANMRRIVTAIQSPYASLEGLRAMVTDPPSSNGNGPALVPR